MMKSQRIGISTVLLIWSGIIALSVPALDQKIIQGNLHNSMNPVGSIGFYDSSPVIGLDDVYVMADATVDSSNTGTGADAATYIAPDRTNLGQIFTTGSSSHGYIISGIWLKNVDYSSSEGNGTWWDVNNPGVVLRLRIIQPSDDIFVVMHSVDFTLTGTETGIELMADNTSVNKTGTGSWVYFELDEHLELNPESQYGFDVSVINNSPAFYFETDGSNVNLYNGGSAYSTENKGDMQMGTVWGGDRAFKIDLEAITEETSTPVSWVLYSKPLDFLSGINLWEPLKIAFCSDRG